VPENHNAILPMFSPMARQPERKYRTIVADPPWGSVLRAPRRFDGYENSQNTYPTMTNEEIAGLPVGFWAQERAHLWLWCLNLNVSEAEKVARAWGFEPRGLVTWVKGRIEGGGLIQHIGLGHYLRTSTEQVVFAVRDSLPLKVSDVPTAFIAPRGQHSEKPAAFYDMVLRASHAPFLDVFARKQRFMFDTFGDEAFNFGTNLPPDAFVEAAR
jgi:N6-adenosine-specific RNA methylase IME4